MEAFKKTALCLFLALVGCNENDDDGKRFSGTVNGIPNSSTPQDGAVAALLALEESKAIPKLERGNTISGVDSDSNGLRDDVERYISENYPIKAQKAAATQAARAIQKVLLITDLTDSALVHAASEKEAQGIQCIYSVFDGSADSMQPAQVVQELVSVTTNTKPRLLAYLAYSKALDGTSMELSEGDTCE